MWKLWRVAGDTKGSVLTEALLVFPFIILFTIAILEFGNVLWQRHQLQTGVRDAARYWARCNQSFHVCNEEIAENIAFYGSPNGSAGGSLRVPGWDNAADLTITTGTIGGAFATQMVIVEAEVDYQNSPLFNLLRIDPIKIRYYHMQRYIGW